MSAAASRPRGRLTVGGRPLKHVLGFVLLVALAAFYIAPLVWMFLSSFKPRLETITWPLTFLPSEWTTRAYEYVLRPGTTTPVFRWFLNSMVAAVLNALLIVCTAAPAAYALARMNFPGKRLVFGAIVSTLFIPPIIFIIPNYLVVDFFGWINRLPAVIFPLAASAFGVFLLRQFFLAIPVELEESARVDGANSFQIFIRIIVPLSKPILATLGVLSFLTNWNDFLWPVYVLFTPDAVTLPPGLSRLQGAYQADYPVILAGAVIASIPVLILFVFLQRFIIESVSQTGVKG
jgi:multiple sugar transport system permease protein